MAAERGGSKDHEPKIEKAQEEREGAQSRPMVVGIGASAGGLDALEDLLPQIPRDSGLAFVVVMHLSPDYESHLADVLQRHCPIAVRQVSETVPLEPNQVYVIPPNRNLSTIDTHLRLVELEERRAERAPIDHFFTTLSESHDGQAIGVVLSGTGSDGALGLRRITERGGLAVVQDPNEARFDGMPQSAIATGMVDFVLEVAQMIDPILRFAKTKPNVRLTPTAEDLEGDERRSFDKILALVRARTSRDFSRYKRSTILRRIARRMQLHRIEEVSEYLEKLREDASEVQSLADEFLITVTEFFRDPEVFEALARSVVPALFEGKSGEDQIRVWSVGCATGEEAYSLAIVLHEEAMRCDAPPHIQVFASDMHEESLKRAREGMYPETAAANISPERLERYFIEENGGYRVRKELRELVVFTPHNLLGDPPFSKLDLISCRNVLIYLQRDIQRRVLHLFHYALRPKGYLMVGTSETVEGADSDWFRAAQKDRCLYQKRDVPSDLPDLPSFPLSFTPKSTERLSGEREIQPASYGGIHQRMVEALAPPSVLLSQSDNVVHLSERAGRYLRYPGGTPTNNVFRLVREELRIELRAALRHARETGEPSRTKLVPVSIDGEQRSVSMDVRSNDEQQEGFVLVIFDERGAPETHVEAASGKPDATARELEAELDLTKRRLRTVIEEYESSQEEMKASNEELQSMNEELRSTMEELETSKEELQSMNEELTTVNQENRHKVEELRQLSSDLQNLMTSTQIATLFLDRELRILRFTPPVSEIFNIRVSDRGRPLGDLTHRLGYDELTNDAERVLDKLTPIGREVQSQGGDWYLTRVLPYRSTQDRIEGVVITFVDITERRRAEEELRKSEERYRLLMENVEEYAIFMLDTEGQISTWNSGAERIFGYRESQAVGKQASILFTLEDREAGVFERDLEESVQEGHVAYERWSVRTDGSRFWVSGVTTALYTSEGEHRGFAMVLRDDTERKAAEATRVHFQALFERAPGLYLVLEPERYEIVAASDAYLEATMTDREEIVGRPLFEVFPEAPEDEGPSGIERVRASLDRVKSEGRADVLGVQRYPIRTSGDRGAEFEERFWSALNTPVFGPDEELAYIIHRVEDVTPFVREMRAEAREDEAHRMLESRAELLETDILLRAGELQRVNEELRRLNETLEDRVAARTEQVRDLASSLTLAEQNERTRIAHVLHDRVQQLLYSLQIRFGLLVEHGDPVKFAEELGDVKDVLQEAIDTTRSLSVEMSPPVLQTEGLAEAFKWLARHMEVQHRLDVALDLDLGDLADLGEAPRAMIYHSCRELLFNAVKHVGADRARLSASFGGGILRVTVADGGAGFDADAALAKEQHGFGLRNIRERLRLYGGSLEIHSDPGQGARIVMTLPVARAGASPERGGSP